MKKVLHVAKPVSIFMTVFVLMMTIPWQTGVAAMIGTETLLEAGRAQQARMNINQLMAHEKVRETLISQGIDPLEAKARIDSLTDAEVIRLSSQIEQSPAGGDALLVIVGASLIVFIVLLITDILGYTNVFPFVS